VSTSGGSKGPETDPLAATAIEPPSGPAAVAPTTVGIPHLKRAAREIDSAGPTRPGETVPGRSDLLVERAEKIDRFVVVGKLGEGGMGVVLAAFDPTLDRKVAIKMLHDGVSEAYGARLEREAKAMAQLSHPNVVTVHETGVFEGRIYIAMEFVDGVTLGKWLREQPRGRDEILDLYVQAGRGLAAAHDVGLVHRDFKPDNVLVGRDGRARVSDFGLVSAVGEVLTVSDRTAPTIPSIGRSSLTVTGAVMGTPLYMAPEQHQGKIADAKADQFSYCVALWHALCGEVPYGADSYDALVENVTGGRLRPIPRGAKVSAKLRAVLVRGLAANPDDRFPTMHALLAAVARARRPARWPWVAAAAVVIAGGATATVLAVRGAKADPCAGGDKRLAGAWSPQRRAAVTAAFHPLGGIADEIAARVTGNLDAYAAGWVASHRKTCEATKVRGEQTAELLDLRMACLDRLRTQLSALADRFAEPSSAMLNQAIDASGALEHVTACDDAARLRAAIPLPADPAARTKIADLEAQFAEARSYDILGRYPEAQRIATPLAQEAKQVGYAPLEAKAILLRAGSEYRNGSLELAEASYREAAEASGRARDDARIAQSWIDLMNVLAAQGKAADALELLVVARTSAERVSEQPELGARLANTVAGIYLSQGKAADAKTEYEKALGFAERAGKKSPIYGHALHNMAIGLWSAGDTEGAKTYFASAREVFLAQVGPNHPSIAYLERNLGDLAVRDGDLDGSIAHYKEAARIWEGAQGKDHVDVAMAYEPMSWALMRKGDLTAARAAGEKALAVRVAKLDPDNPQIAQSQLYLADIDTAEGTPASLDAAEKRVAEALRSQEARLGTEDIKLAATLDRMAVLLATRGKTAQALGIAERGLAIRTKVLGDHSDTAYSHLLVGEAQLALGKPVDAAKNFERAAVLWEKANGVADPDVAKARTEQAEALSQQGKHAEALALVDKWIPIGEKAGAPPQQLGGMRAAHVRILYAAGRKVAAIALATSARAAIAGDGTAARALAELDAWLAAHAK
jgi:tetratricopeptide (TPR) repeat protein